jgi:hypothetical protein
MTVSCNKLWTLLIDRKKVYKGIRTALADARTRAFYALILSSLSNNEANPISMLIV